jgi:ABC-type lipoprotein release transport system permease subunit
MKFPFWLSWKEFEARRVRFFIHILPVGLVVGFCLFIELAAYSRVESVKNQTNVISPSIRIFPAGLTSGIIIQKGSGGVTINQEILTEIKKEFREQVSTAAGRMIVKHNNGKAAYLVIGYDPENIITPFIYLKSLKDNEAAPGAEVSKKMNAREGSIISVEGKELQVKFLLPSLGSFDDAAVFTTLKTAQDITKQPGQVNEISIYLRAGIIPSDVSKRLRSMYPELTVQIIKDENSSEKPLDSHLTVYGSLINILSAVIMIFYIFVLALLNARERKLEISTLYAIGASGRGVMLLLTVRSLIVSVTGSILGCSAGTILIMIFAADPFTAVTLNFKLYIIAILVSAGVSILATLPAALISGYRNHVQVLQESWGC